MNRVVRPGWMGWAEMKQDERAEQLIYLRNQTSLWKLEKRFAIPVFNTPWHIPVFNTPWHHIGEIIEKGEGFLVLSQTKPEAPLLPVGMRKSIKTLKLSIF